MDLRLTELQELLKSSAEDFIQREVPPDRVREIELSGAADEGLWSQIAELGWPALAVAEEYGGQGGSLMDIATLVQQLCRGAVLSPYQASTLCALTVQRFGDDALKQQLLPRLAEGTVSTAASIEQSGDVDAPIAASYTDGKVSGEKYFVEYARSADYHLVTAMQGGTPGIAVVPRAQSGVTLTRDLKSIGSTPAAVVSYADADADAFIAGQEAVDYLAQLGAALASLESYSYAQKSLDMIVDYSQMRVQFGRPIGSFEAVQQRIADMAIQVEACKFLSHELLWNFDAGSVDPEQVHMVKAITGRAASDVTMWSHVLHGGIGYMKEYDLQFFTRRGKESALRWGGVREATNAVAETVFA